MAAVSGALVASEVGGRARCQHGHVVPLVPGDLDGHDRATLSVGLHQLPRDVVLAFDGFDLAVGAGRDHRRREALEAGAGVETCVRLGFAGDLLLGAVRAHPSMVGDEQHGHPTVTVPLVSEITRPPVAGSKRMVPPGSPSTSRPKPGFADNDATGSNDVPSAAATSANTPTAAAASSALPVPLASPADASAPIWPVAAFDTPVEVATSATAVMATLASSAAPVPVATPASALVNAAVDTVASSAAPVAVAAPGWAPTAPW